MRIFRFHVIKVVFFFIPSILILFHHFIFSFCNTRLKWFATSLTELSQIKVNSILQIRKPFPNCKGLEICSSVLSSSFARRFCEIVFYFQSKIDKRFTLEFENFGRLSSPNNIPRIENIVRNFYIKNFSF